MTRKNEAGRRVGPVPHSPRWRYRIQFLFRFFGVFWGLSSVTNVVGKSTTYQRRPKAQYLLADPAGLGQEPTACDRQNFSDKFSLPQNLAGNFRTFFPFMPRRLVAAGDASDGGAVKAVSGAVWEWCTYIHFPIGGI